MSRISYARVLVELDLFADLKSSIVINLPNGSTLHQPMIYETLPRFCKLCKVLGHNTGTCTSPPALAVARPLEKESHPSIVTNKSRNVFDRLGPVAEPSLGKAKGQIGEASHSYDPMTTKVAVASGEWEIVKRKKARKSPGIPVGSTHTADQVSTIPARGKAPALSSSEGICNSDRNPPPIIHNGKEPVGAVPCRKVPNVVHVGVTTIRSQRMSTSRASRSGRVPLPPPLM
jgi:hypothetical protein